MEKTNKIWNRRFILLFITNLLVPAAFYASIPIIPVYCQQIGITGSGVGIVLTAMSVATVLFRPIAGYLLDNFNRYHVYLIFLAMFCIAFPLFLAFPFFGALVIIRLYMGAVYSVCGSATMTLAGDVLPLNKITEGISDGDIMRYLRTIDYTPISMGETVFFMDVFRDPNVEFEQKLNQVMDLNALEIGVDEPLTIPASASLEEACTAMSKAGVKKMPVVIDGKIVGIASRSAITRYLISRYLEQTEQSVLQVGNQPAPASQKA